jgi:hypothetical protein
MQNLLYLGCTRLEGQIMQVSTLRISMILCLALTQLSVNLAIAQKSPSITNVTSAANPAAMFPALAPGSMALIVGNNLAESTASAAPPQTSLGRIEVHLVGLSSDVVAGLVYVSPTGISFVVPSIPNTEVRNTRVAIVKDDQRFDNLTSPGSVVVGAVSIESSPNPALPDQPITFTAHVTAMQGVPGSLANTIGSVNFMDGDTPLGLVKLSNVITYTDAPPLRRYDVSFTTSRLVAGKHSVRADYTGDNNNNPGTSGVMTQSVQPGEVTIWTGPNPSIHGNTVTIVATVSPSTCTGTVVFFDETDQLGTAAIDPTSGRALIQTAALTVGNHPITVKYNGDSNCPPLQYGPANDFFYRITSQTVNPSVY